MNSQIVFAIFLGLAAATPQKKVVDPAKDIKFDHHDEEKHHIDHAVDKEPHDQAAHVVDHHTKDHHDHHAIDHHFAAQYEHKLRNHAHQLAEHDHALAHHVLPHYPPVVPLDKHTSYLLIPLPAAAAIPVKPGALYDPHVKKHALFVPAAHH